MRIQITRYDFKKHVIKYTRDDQSETWMYADDFFVRHDLSHYAFEKVMRYKTAFNGMINSGMDIHEFENREQRAGITISDEACYAENVANLFLIETIQGQMEDFNSVQQNSFRPLNRHRGKMTIPDEKINATRTLLKQLLKKWEELPNGETMELTFE